MKVCDSSRHAHTIFFVLFSQAAASLLSCAVLTFPHCASQLLALIIYSHPFLRLCPPPPSPLVATNLCLFLSLHLYLSVDSPIFVIHWISRCIIAFYPVFFSSFFSLCTYPGFYGYRVLTDKSKEELKQCIFWMQLIALSNNSSNPCPLFSSAAQSLKQYLCLMKMHQRLVY